MSVINPNLLDLASRLSSGAQVSDSSMTVILMAWQDLIANKAYELQNRETITKQGDV